MAISNNPNEQLVYNFLIGTAGYNSAVASGIMSNIYHESGFKTTALGDNGTSFGLIQWHKGRWTAMKEYCRKNNYDDKSVVGQMSFFLYEVNSSYKKTANAFKNSANNEAGAYNAAYWMCKDYERPADTENTSVKRANYAKGTVYPIYSKGTQTPPGKPAEDPKPTSGEEILRVISITKSKSISGQYTFYFIDSKGNRSTYYISEGQLGSNIKEALKLLNLGGPNGNVLPTQLNNLLEIKFKHGYQGNVKLPMNVEVVSKSTAIGMIKSYLSNPATSTGSQKIGDKVLYLDNLPTDLREVKFVQGIVKRVIDGDTLVLEVSDCSPGIKDGQGGHVSVGKSEVKIRLVGIDCLETQKSDPEGQKKAIEKNTSWLKANGLYSERTYKEMLQKTFDVAAEAKKFVEDLVLGKKVTTLIDTAANGGKGFDIFSRLLGVVYVQQGDTDSYININKSIVNNKSNILPNHNLSKIDYRSGKDGAVESIFYPPAWLDNDKESKPQDMSSASGVSGGTRAASQSLIDFMDHHNLKINKQRKLVKNQGAPASVIEHVITNEDTIASIIFRYSNDTSVVAEEEMAQYNDMNQKDMRNTFDTNKASLLGTVIKVPVRAAYDSNNNQNNSPTSYVETLYTSNLNEIPADSEEETYLNSLNDDRDYLDGFSRDMYSTKEIDEIKDLGFTRIGDCTFVVPPTSIHMNSVAQTTKYRSLRSKASVKTQSGYSDNSIQLELFFVNEEQINGERFTNPEFGHYGITDSYYRNGLRPLIAQFKKAPFLPIENKMINETLGVYSVALKDLQLSTVPGFPGYIKATLLMYEFDHSVYMHSDEYFEGTFNWKLFRWYYQQVMQRNNIVKGRTYLQYVDTLDDSIEFSLLDESELAARTQAISSFYDKVSPNIYKETHTDINTSSGGMINDGLMVKLGRAQSDSFDKWLSIYDAKSYPLFYNNGTFIGLDNFDIKDYKTNKETERYFHAGVELIKFMYNPTTTITPIKNRVTGEEQASLKKTTTSSNEVIFVPKGLNNLVEFLNKCNKTGLTSEPLYSSGAEIGFEKNDKGLMNLRGLKSTGLGSAGSSDKNFIGTLKTLTKNSYIIPLFSTENKLENAKYQCKWPAVYDFEEDKDNPLPGSGELINSSTSRYYIFDPEKDYFQMSKLERKSDLALGSVEKYEEDFVELKKKANLTENDMARKKFNIAGEFWIESIGANLSNLLIPLQVNGMATRSHQFIGSDDTSIQMRIRTKDEKAVNSFKRLAEESQRLMREYRIAITAGILQIENNIFGLVGARDTIIEQVSIMNAPNDKESFIIEISMTTFERTQALEENLDHDDLAQSFDDLESFRAFSKQRRKDPNFQYGTTDLRLRDLELYPDLELPTHDEVNKALSHLGLKGSSGSMYKKLPNPHGAKFVDPDFYVRASDTVREQVVKSLLNEQPGILLKDSNNFAGIDMGPTPQQEMMDKPLVEFSTSAKAWLDSNLDTYTVSDSAHKENDGEMSLIGIHNTYMKEGLDRKKACMLDLKMNNWDCEIAEKDPDGPKYRTAYINNLFRAHNRKVKPSMTGKLSDTFSVKMNPSAQDMYNEILSGNVNIGQIANDYKNSLKVPGNSVMPDYIEGRVAWLHKLFKENMKEDKIARNRKLVNPSHTEIHSEIKRLTASYFGNHYQENSASTNYALDRKHLPHKDTFHHGTESISAPQITQEKIFNVILALFDYQSEWIHSVLSDGVPSPYLTNEGALGISGINVESGIFFGQNDIIKAAFDWKYNLQKAVSYFALCFSWAQGSSDLFISNNPLDGAVIMYDRGRGTKNVQTAIDSESRYTPYYNSFLDVYSRSYGRDDLWDITTPGQLQNKDLIKGESVIDEIEMGKQNLPSLDPTAAGNIRYIVLGYPDQKPTQGGYSKPEENPHDYSNYNVKKPKMLAISDPGKQIRSSKDTNELGKLLKYDADSHNRSPLEYLLFRYASIYKLDSDNRVYVLQDGTLDYLIREIETLATPDVDQIVKGIGDNWKNAIREVSYTDEQGMKDIAIDMLEDQLFASMNYNQGKIAESFRGSFHDILNYDQRGRLVRAFPTFQMFLIEEGRWMWYHKLWDRFYGYNSIISIDVIKDRRVAADTAVITLSNLYHNLNTKDNSISYGEYDLNISDLILGDKEDREKIWYSIWGLPTKAVLHAQNEKLNTMVLKPGARVHLRMGYGSNAFELPVMMNGVISEMDTEEVITIIVQGDGIELTNKLHAEPNETTNPGIIAPVTEPRKTMCSLLTSRGSFFKNIVNKVTGGVFQRTHPLGIVHFGNEVVPNTLIVPLFDFVEPQFGESGINVYSSSGINTFSQWIYTEGEKKGRHIGMEWGRLMIPRGKGDEPNVVLELYDKTTWDIFQAYSAVSPDYIAAVHPFEYRSTIFYGKPWWGMVEKYQYEYHLTENMGLGRKVSSFYRKPFSQFRFYTSQTDIISNKIKATSEYMYTNVIGAYTTKEGEKLTQVVQFDSDIKPQHQTTAIVHIPIKAKKYMSYFTQDRYALNSAVSALKDYAKEMYQGELLVLGDPSVKPHDVMYLMDQYTDMTGNAGVKRVIHHFSFETGFVSSITPDCLAMIDDQQGFSLTQWNNSIGMRISGYVLGQAAANLAWQSMLRGPVASTLRMYGAKGASVFYNVIVEGQVLNAIDAMDDVGVARLMHVIKESGTDAYSFNTLISEAVANGNVSPGMISAFLKKSVETSHSIGLIQEGSYNTLSTLLSKILKPFRAIYENPETAYKVVDEVFDKTKFLNKSLFPDAKGIFKPVANFAFKTGTGAVKVTAAATGNVSAKGLRLVSNVLGNPAARALTLNFVYRAVMIVVTDTVFEAYGRFLECRQAIIVMPLQYRGRNFVAGIDGHAGSVVGDTPSKMDKFFEGNGFAAPVMQLVNAIASVKPNYTPPAIGDFERNENDD